MRSRRCKFIQQIFWKHASPATSNWQKLYDVEVDFWSHWTLLISDFQILRNASKGWRRESQRNCHILVSDLANSPWCASVFCFSQVTVQRTWKATSWTLPNASCLQLKPLVRVKYTLSTWVWAVSPSLYNTAAKPLKPLHLRKSLWQWIMPPSPPRDFVQ